MAIIIRHSLHGFANIGSHRFSWDFTWTSGPGGGICPDCFHRALDRISPASYGETYTFYGTANDGVRLWVNGQLLADGWFDKARQSLTKVQLSLKAQQLYNNRNGLLSKHWRANRWASMEQSFHATGRHSSNTTLSLHQSAADSRDFESGNNSSYTASAV